MLRYWIAACSLFIGLLAAGPASAQAEHEVKAAFLSRFLPFVEWPPASFARPESPILIGVMGADDVLAVLQDAVAGRVVQARPVVARAVREGDSLAGLHMLFVARPATAALSRIAPGGGLLVVADAEGALDRGAAINFVRSDGRIRFEVALDNAAQQRVRISSRLLGIAASVRGGP